jgi:hypothetical protein
MYVKLYIADELKLEIIYITDNSHEMIFVYRFASAATVNRFSSSDHQINMLCACLIKFKCRLIFIYVRYALLCSYQQNEWS